MPQTLNNKLQTNKGGEMQTKEILNKLIPFNTLQRQKLNKFRKLGERIIVAFK